LTSFVLLSCFIKNAHNLAWLGAAFPLITTGPGLIAAFMGVFLFSEIQGKKNYVVLTLAFLFTGFANFLIVKSH